MSTDRLVTLKEARELLAPYVTVSLTALRYAVISGDLPAVRDELRPGVPYMVSVAQLMAWRAKHLLKVEPRPTKRPSHKRTRG